EGLPAPRDELQPKTGHEDHGVKDEQDHVTAQVARSAGVLRHIEDIKHRGPKPRYQPHQQEIPAANKRARDQQAPRRAIEGEDDREYDRLRLDSVGSPDLPVEVEQW